MSGPKKSTKETAKGSSSDTKASVLYFLTGVIVLLINYFAYESSLGVLGWNTVHLHTITDRLVFTLRLESLPLLVLLISNIHIMFARYKNPKTKNPLSGNDNLIALPIRVNQNNIEHYLLHLGNQLILATFLPEDKLKVLPLLAMLFFVGRIMFHLGFCSNPKY